MDEKNVIQLSRNELKEKNDQLNQQLISMLQLIPETKIMEHEKNNQTNDLDKLYRENR